MRWHKLVLIAWVALGLGGIAFGRQTKPAPVSPPAKAPAKKTPAASQTAPKSKPDADAEPGNGQNAGPDPDTELQVTVQAAANDNAALVRNLEAYLKKYPDSPRRVAIYRALLQSEMRLQDQKRALDYAEQVIALQPEDSQTMFLAVSILEKMPDEASQLHAIDYDTRLIDRVSKANPDTRPQQMSLDDWQAGRNKFTMDLYVLRGRMQKHMHKNDEAVKDLTVGFRLLPNAGAALTLGEIAEEQKNADEAVRQYAMAFVLSGQDQDDPTVNRDSLRQRMGNLWRFTHNSNNGLGDVMLSAYDKNLEISKAEQPETPTYNKDVTDPLQFSLRTVDGKGAVKLADSRGKVVILNLWTTWCAYCRIMESLLTDVRKKFVGRDDLVTMAVNADEMGSLVTPFLQEEKVEGTQVFADGLGQALHVESIPTIIVLDRSGKIAYRAQGFAPEGFVDAISAAIAKASAAPAQ